MSSIEITEKEANVSSWRFVKGMLPGILGLGIVMFKHPVTTLKMTGEFLGARKRVAGKDRSRKLPYHIPPYRPEMAHTVSDRVYLRPIRGIESQAPEIIAMANHLGAYQKSDWDYAFAVFEFVKHDVYITFEAPFRGALGALKFGEGTCLDKTQLFIALCRAASIPGRIRWSQEVLAQSMFETGLENQIVQEWYDQMGYFLAHAMAEAYIDSKWVPADFSTDYRLEAKLGLPIAHLGDEPEGTWNWPVPGTLIHCEAFPAFFAFILKLVFKMSGSMLRVYQGLMEEVIEAGKKVIDESGGIEAYDRRVRLNYKARMPEVSKKLFKALKETEAENAKTEMESGLDVARKR
jgi:hypothetical protein